jgi:hypothetical protein
LAGGGWLLPEAYARWLKSEAPDAHARKALWKRTSGYLTLEPLQALCLPPSAHKKFARARRVAWRMSDSGLVMATPEE